MEALEFAAIFAGTAMAIFILANVLWLALRAILWLLQRFLS